MLKKFLAVMLVTASFVFASDVWSGNSGGDEYSGTTSSTYQVDEYSRRKAPAPPAPPVDYKFAVGAQPFSLLIFGAQSNVALYMTIELGFGSSFSFITRPVYLDIGRVEGWGITEGFRYYFGSRGHRGWYIEPEVQYVSVTGSKNERYYNGYGYSSHERIVSVSGVGVYLLGGYKLMKGHFMLGGDAGIGMNFYDTDDSDVKDVIRDGFWYDCNFYIGFAF